MEWEEAGRERWCAACLHREDVGQGRGLVSGHRAGAVLCGKSSFGLEQGLPEQLEERRRREEEYTYS